MTDKSGYVAVCDYGWCECVSKSHQSDHKQHLQQSKTIYHNQRAAA